MNRTYLCIDLKSFYASVECVDRGLDPMTTNLVVADLGRTEKTICLAVTPSLKAYGISGRARLFEVVQRVAEVNRGRRYKAPGRTLVGESYCDPELKSNPSLALGYIVAPPRMAHYMEVSAEIYNVYLKYIAPEDIHVYSIDEVFIDLTHYLGTYQRSAHDIAQMLIRDVLATTGITATAGILLSNRTELIEVSKFLGHSTIATTANIYAHLDMSNKEHTASVMSDILAGMNTTKAPK